MISLAYAALWVFVFSVPWERIIVLPGLLIITRATGALALGLTLFAVVMSGRVRRWHPLHVSALLFVMWSGIGVLILHIDDIPKKFYTFIMLFAVAWMIWELAPSRGRQVGLLLAYLFGAYVAALDTLLLFASQAGSLRRFAAGGADPNSHAMTLALALPIAWYMATTHPRPLLRLVCRGYLPVALFAVALTGSRGGLITSMVGLLIIPLTMTNMSPGRMVAAIAILAISGALAVTYVPDTLVERFASTGESVQSLSFGGRFKLWTAGMHAWNEKPLMGYGTSAFKSAVYAELGDLTQVAHNSFVSILVEEGLIGLLLYLGMLVAAFLSVLRLRGLERRFALVLLTTLFFTLLPLTWEDQKPVWIILGALVGLSNAQVGSSSRPVRYPVAPQPAPIRSPVAAARAMHRPAPRRRNFGPDPSA